MITFKLQLGTKEVELTTAEAKELYSQLDQLFGKPVQPYIPHYGSPGDSTGSPWPGLPYKVTCVDAVLSSGVTVNASK